MFFLQCLMDSSNHFLTLNIYDSNKQKEAWWTASMFHRQQTPKTSSCSFALGFAIPNFSLPSTQLPISGKHNWYIAFLPPSFWISQVSSSNEWAFKETYFEEVLRPRGNSKYILEKNIFHVVLNSEYTKHFVYSRLSLVTCSYHYIQCRLWVHCPANRWGRYSHIPWDYCAYYTNL